MSNVENLTLENPTNGVFHAFVLISKFRELVLTQKELAGIDIEQVEAMLDEIETIALNMSVDFKGPYENSISPEI